MQKGVCCNHNRILDHVDKKDGEAAEFKHLSHSLLRLLVSLTVYSSPSHDLVAILLLARFPCVLQGIVQIGIKFSFLPFFPSPENKSELRKRVCLARMLQHSRSAGSARV